MPISAIFGYLRRFPPSVFPPVLIMGDELLWLFPPSITLLFSAQMVEASKFNCKLSKMQILDILWVSWIVEAMMYECVFIYS